jgi:hypothetical protein
VVAHAADDTQNQSPTVETDANNVQPTARKKSRKKHYRLNLDSLASTQGNVDDNGDRSESIDSAHTPNVVSTLESSLKAVAVKRLSLSQQSVDNNNSTRRLSDVNSARRRELLGGGNNSARSLAASSELMLRLTTKSPSSQSSASMASSDLRTTPRRLSNATTSDGGGSRRSSMRVTSLVVRLLFSCDAIADRNGSINSRHFVVSKCRQVSVCGAATSLLNTIFAFPLTQ